MSQRTYTIEQRLIAAGQGSSTDTKFIHDTMQAVRTASSNNTFEQQLNKPVAKHMLWPAQLRRLSRTSLVTIAASAFLLASGSAYAAYTLWLSPSAQLRSVTTQYGHSQAFIDLKDCYSKDQKVNVEIANDSNGNATQAMQALIAHCEIQAIQGWAMQTFHGQPSSIEFAYTVSKIDKTSITVQDPQTQQSQQFSLAKSLPITYKGAFISGGSLKRGDTVALVLGSSGKSLAAIAKLSYPPALYTSDQIQQSYYERQSCIGNSEDSCADLPSVDVAYSGEGGVNPDTTGKPYQIQGKLMSYTTSTFTLEGTSGKHYTIHTASDLINGFNTQNPYGLTIATGDVLMVIYSSDGSPQNIESTQYHMIQLLLQNASKQPPTNAQKYHY